MRIALILLILNSFPSISQIAHPPTIEIPELVPDSIAIENEVIIGGGEAQFPGGFDSLKQYFQEFGKYIPENWSDSNFNKRGYVVFIVEADGSFSDILVHRSINREADLLMIELIEKMPNWIPACDRYGPVRSRVRLPVTFTRQE